jgi:hypothetical protein
MFACSHVRILTGMYKSAATRLLSQKLFLLYCNKYLQHRKMYQIEVVEINRIYILHVVRIFSTMRHFSRKVIIFVRASIRII